NLASGSGIWLLDFIRSAIPVPTVVYLGLTAMVMAGLAIAALRRPPDPLSSLPWATALGAAALLLASPHYPWYFVWLVALLCVGPWWPAWWPSLTAFLLYWHTKAGQSPPWVGFTIYGGFAILSGVDIAWRSIIATRPGERHGSRRAG